MPVGRQTFVTHEKANAVALPLIDDVGGVNRLTVYDYRENPPRPLAERLVYRRRAGRLDVGIKGKESSYTSGDPVEEVGLAAHFLLLSELLIVTDGDLNPTALPTLP